MSRALDLSDQRFGRWIALELVRGSGSGRHRCRCDCGVEAVVWTSHLRSGRSKSCGCLAADISSRRDRSNDRPTSLPRHGHASGYKMSATYISWRAMLQRCTNPKTIQYRFYGGRGIAVCNQWRSFEAFLADMGERPAGTTLDRRDGNGGYEPGNCRWASDTVQRMNLRTAKLSPTDKMQVAWLRIEGGFTLRRIADAFGVSVYVVGNAASRARRDPSLFARWAEAAQVLR